MRFALLLVMLASSGSAFGASRYGGGDYESFHWLSVGGGIAHPSATTAITENPAGLIYNSDLRILASSDAGNNSFNPLGANGHFFLGNGAVGGGIGLRNQHTFNTATDVNLDFGLAAEINALKLAFGVSGSYRVATLGATGGGGGTPGLNIGVLINPTGEIHGGLTLFDVLGGVNALGGGIAWDVNSFATLALDAATTPTAFQAWSLKPGLQIHVLQVQLSASYGFALAGGGSWLRGGGTLGLGVRMGGNLHFQAYYNELNLYYAGLMFHI
jgi:hypothetical protein